jgi:translation initiation factor IF-1
LGKDVIELIGLVEESFPNATFAVRVLSSEAKDHRVLCHLAGRMRVRRIRILPGDRVKIEMTPYDLRKGRIVYRYRGEQMGVDHNEGGGEFFPKKAHESP